jgi:hypothetical protein
MPTFAEYLRNMFHKIERNLTDNIDDVDYKYTYIINKYDLYEELPELGSYYEQFMNIPIDPETGVVTRPNDEKLRQLITISDNIRSASSMSRNECVDMFVLIIHAVLYIYSCRQNNKSIENMVFYDEFVNISRLSCSAGFDPNDPNIVLDYATDVQTKHNVFGMNVLAMIIDDACIESILTGDRQSLL